MVLLSSFKNHRIGTGKTQPIPEAYNHMQGPMLYHSPVTVIQQHAPYGLTTNGPPTNSTPIDQENQRLLHLTQTMAEERMREKAIYSDFLETAHREKYGDRWHLHLKSEHPTFEIKRKPVPSSQLSSRDSSPSASSSHYSDTPMNEYSSGSWFNAPSPSSSRSSSRSPSRSETSSRSDSSKTLVNGGKHSHLANGRNHSHAAVWPVSYNPTPYIARRPLSIISEDCTGETAARAARQALLQTAQRQVTPVATGHKNKLKYAPAPRSHLARGTMRNRR
ncbi:hypothetical protein CSAL01_00817 [Colletotrichum salicis]|uniref:Uncharacterized protein n=1 Tax=Colletotrichum salicis TaxID=1209931 RepID=A0A135V4G4_9PEZI|nr:hypothetical protein CSAL01_00817 [Colletotrichum salicis]